MTKKQVKCPRCGKPTLFSSENPHRPFCSDRCKLIDLGEWAEGKYAIPVAPTPEDLAEESGTDEGTPFDPGSGSDESDASPYGTRSGIPGQKH